MLPSTHFFFYLIQSQDSTIGPIVLDLVRTVQEHVMNASYSVPVTKPFLTKNIRKFLKTNLYRTAEDIELMTKYWV